MARNGESPRVIIPRWLVLGVTVTPGIHFLAFVTTGWTIALMGAVGDFALKVRDFEMPMVWLYNSVAFPVTSAIVVAYLWPVAAYFRVGTPQPAPVVIQRRAIGGPLFVAVMSFAAWVLATVCFPAATLLRFGHWSTQLMSQQVLSPLVNGFLASSTCYFFLDWLFRRDVMPRVFPDGRVSEVPGAFALGVRGHLLVYLVAVAFTPLFTMLGLFRAAAARVEAGQGLAIVVAELATASVITFAVYVTLGLGLTFLVARFLTRPLREMAAALRRVQAGDLDVHVEVTASDEVGVLAEGVNEMVSALREKERILQTFGRVVDPSVRDRLLDGNLRPGGEVREASVLFCDLRGFTGMAERTPPEEVVTTLNQFFTAMTTWVHECGGFVDKFIGDAMLAVFGLFESDGRFGEAASAAALRCAVGMRNRLVQLNASRAHDGQPPLAISGGVHTGEVVAGTIGARERHEYTVIGDAVNVAARLQQLCKERGDDFLVTETTYELARSAGFVGAVTGRQFLTLRGRIEPIRVFGLA